MVTDRTDFMLIKDAAISGYNNEYLTGVTPNECAAQCAARTAFTCRSFDHNPSTNECWMSEENDQTQSVTSTTTYHLYVRICKLSFGF